MDGATETEKVLDSKLYCDDDEHKDDDKSEDDNVPDPDAHNRKQTIVKGLMNMAIITSNCAQLKTLVFTHRDRRFGLWLSLIIMIVISLILQLVMAAMLFYIYNISIYAKKEILDCTRSGDVGYIRIYKEKDNKRKAGIRNALILFNTVAVLAMIGTVLNMVIAAMGWT